MALAHELLRVAHREVLLGGGDLALGQLHLVRGRRLLRLRHHARLEARLEPRALGVRLDLGEPRLGQRGRVLVAHARRGVAAALGVVRGLERLLRVHLLAVGDQLLGEELLRVARAHARRVVALDALLLLVQLLLREAAHRELGEVELVDAHVVVLLALRGGPHVHDAARHRGRLRLGLARLLARHLARRRVRVEAQSRGEVARRHVGGGGRPRSSHLHAPGHSGIHVVVTAHVERHHCGVTVGWSATQVRPGGTEMVTPVRVWKSSDCESTATLVKKASLTDMPDELAAAEAMDMVGSTGAETSAVALRSIAAISLAFTVTMVPLTAPSAVEPEEAAGAGAASGTASLAAAASPAASLVVGV